MSNLWSIWALEFVLNPFKLEFIDFFFPWVLLVTLRFLNVLACPPLSLSASRSIRTATCCLYKRVHAIPLVISVNLLMDFLEFCSVGVVTTAFMFIQGLGGFKDGVGTSVLMWKLWFVDLLKVAWNVLCDPIGIHINTCLSPQICREVKGCWLSCRWWVVFLEGVRFGRRI